jgi:hypothetical protein
MKLLSQEDVLAMTKAQRQELLDSLESRMGELDYTNPAEEDEYNVIAENVELLINKIFFNEY